MAIILNIETATSICSVAISQNGNVIALEESDENNVHAEKLTVFIQNVLSNASLSLKELDAIAIGSGPGSFTGLRIGASAAKGLSYALNKPLIVISTLKAMASAARKLVINNARPNENPFGWGIQLFCPMIDARRLEVYTALFDKEGNEVIPVNAKILDAASFSEYIQPLSTSIAESERKGTIAFFGDGMHKMRNFITTPNPNFVYLDTIYASAANMANLAEEAFQKEDFNSVAYYEPFYLKDFAGTKKTIQS